MPEDHKEFLDNIRIHGFQDLLLKDGDIAVRVDYYDEDEARLLRQQGVPGDLVRVAGQVVQIPIAEFLTYCLFVNKRDELPGFSSFPAIRSNLEQHLSDFDLGLRITPTSLGTHLVGDNQIVGLSEKIGVGVGLSVASRIHGL